MCRQEWFKELEKFHMIRDTEIQVLSPVLSFLEDRAEDGDDWAEYPGFSADPVANTGTSAWKTICPAHFFDADNIFWAKFEFCKG